MKLYLVNQMGFSSFLYDRIISPVANELKMMGYEVFEPFAQARRLMPARLHEDVSMRLHAEQNERFVREATEQNFGFVEVADVVAALLDGSHDCDSGSCVELGYAAALKRPIFAMRTDIRGGEPGCPVNGMIVGAIERSGGQYCASQEEFFSGLREFRQQSF